MQNPLRAKGAVTALSLTSLICAILGSINYFVLYMPMYLSGPSLSLRVPALRDLLSFLWYIAPYVLLAVCILFYRGKKKDTVLFTAALASLAFSIFWNFALTGNLERPSFQPALIFLLTLPMPIAASVCAMSGRAKVFVIIGTALGMFAELIELPSTLEYVRFTLNSSFYLHTATYLIGTLGTLMLNVTFLVFATTNTPPSLFGQTEC